MTVRRKVCRDLLSTCIFCTVVMTVMPARSDADGSNAGGSTPPRPVVVELFTSQGCSSCPPADALLRDLARRGDVLALGFHVDYWNGLGWKDPYSTPESTTRQQTYSRLFNLGTIYTPQMVVDGQQQIVGSDRVAVMSAIDTAKPETLVQISFAPDRRHVALAAAAPPDVTPDEAGTSITLLRFIRQRTTDVPGGENSGRQLNDADSVIALRPLGAWSGTQQTFPIDPPGAGEGVAVLVQAADGHILGAGMALSP